MVHNDHILALTLYGEARGEVDRVGVLSLQAVGFVIVNRLHHGGFGRSIEDVCLQPYQFSCWNKNDPNFDILINDSTLKDPIFELCYHTAEDLLNQKMQDFTQRATHYHARNIHPYWAKTMHLTLLIGNHMFYKNAR